MATAGQAPTVYDVAAHAGVSIATVSRALRRPGDVTPATRERILASVRHLGYVPSGSARGLAARRTGVLGLYLPGFDAMDSMDDTRFATSPGAEILTDIPDAGGDRPFTLYFDEVLRGSELEAWRQGHALMAGVGRGSNREEVFNEFVGHVDAVAVMAQSVPDDLLEHVARRIPVVLIAGPPRGDRFDHVSVSNAEGMRELTSHLIEAHGVRDPVYVAGNYDSPDDAERYSGFTGALADHGIDASELALYRSDFSRQRARQVADDILSAGEPPRALVCSNDQMALGILDVFGRRGIRVPEEAIVTGFDGIEESRHSTPRITTVHQPMEDLGRAAVQVMLRRLQDAGQAPITLRLPVRVLLRESCEGRSS